MKKIAIVAAAFAMSITGTAFAGDFGAGNSAAGPQDANAKCHPPGQTSDLPQCR